MRAIRWCTTVAMGGLVWTTTVSAQVVRPVEPMPARPTVISPAPSVTMPTPNVAPSLQAPSLQAPTLAVPKPPPPAAPMAATRPRKCWCHERTPSGGSMKTKCAPDCCRGNRDDDRC